MSAIKKVIFWAFMLSFLFTGFWMVIVNNDSVSLNLLFTNTGPVNAGFVIFMSLTVGAIVGFIAGGFSARLSIWRKSREAEQAKAQIQAAEAETLAAERERARQQAIGSRNHEPPAPPPVY
ncbi:MAG: LapA family protein [Paraperlucidibaca sp.]